MTIISPFAMLTGLIHIQGMGVIVHVCQGSRNLGILPITEKGKVKGKNYWKGETRYVERLIYDKSAAASSFVIGRKGGYVVMHAMKILD